MERYQIGSHIEAYPYEKNQLTIFNKNSGTTFVLGESESQVFKLMNGANTITDIQAQCPFFSAEDIEKLADAFSQIGLFETKKRRFNPFKITFRLCNPNRLFKENGIVTNLLHYALCIGAPALFLIALFAIRLKADPVAFISASLAAFSSLTVCDVAMIALFSLICLALPEAGHMITARHYGVNVPELGLMLYFFIPCAYVVWRAG